MSQQGAQPSKAIQDAHDILFIRCTEDTSKMEKVVGYDFDNGVNYEALMKAMYTTGIQATHVGRAVKIINNMLEWRSEGGDKCTIFLGYTSNMVSCGVREIIKFLVKHKLVDCLVTTCGGIEEDFIKCKNPFYLGEFTLKGKDLRAKGINRTGNMQVPNDNYADFEDWVAPILDQMYKEQQEEGAKWCASAIIDRLGKEINNEESIYYWCHKNQIPVFCPAITDGSIGDMLFFHAVNNEPGINVNVVDDVKKMNLLTLAAKRSGTIILGGGVIKHHILNSNLMRGGVDYAVYCNTGHEWDASDCGASPDEAISWCKINLDAEYIKINAEATLVFPLLVAQTFAPYHEKQQQLLKQQQQQEEEKKN